MKKNRSFTEAYILLDAVISIFIISIFIIAAGSFYSAAVSRAAEENTSIASYLDEYNAMAESMEIFVHGE